MWITSGILSHVDHVRYLVTEREATRKSGFVLAVCSVVAFTHSLLCFRTIEILSQSQNDKEKTRLDVDLEMRSLKYKLEQEMEGKNMVERLCNQLKDQLGRSEKKLSR